MKVIGTETRNVTIEVSAQECFLALAEHFGLKKVFYPDDDSYYKEIHTNGTLTQLQLMRDCSKHGSACYEFVGEPITDPTVLDTYTHLNAIHQKIFQ